MQSTVAEEQGGGVAGPARPFAPSRRLDRQAISLGAAVLVGVVAWFMPNPPGLPVVGQHAMAVTLTTIILWLTEVLPSGAASLIMMGLVLSVMRTELPATQFLSFWTSDTIWFAVVSFAFGAAVQVSGLGRRLGLYIFSIRRLLYVNLAFFGLLLLFDIVGMASSFPKIVILFPLLISAAALSGLDKHEAHVKQLALVINILANQTGLLLYTGFIQNPVMATLAGFQVNYITWIQWFFVPALVLNIVSFLVVYFLFYPRHAPKGTGFNTELLIEERKKLGPLSALEVRTAAWLGFAILLWATTFVTGIPSGFAAMLVAGLMMLPRFGVLKFDEFVARTSWNMVFFIAGILAIGGMASTGFGAWIWSMVLPQTLPSNPSVSLGLISLLVEVLHIPLGSIGTSQALAIPSIVALAPALGMSPKLLAIVAYLSIACQFFFVYQNATLVVGQAFGLWSNKDIFKFGAAMFLIIPVLMAVVLMPYWSFMGWL